MATGVLRGESDTQTPPGPINSEINSPPVFFAGQIGGYWTGIPPKCLQFGCWNSPSKRWGSICSMFHICSPHVEWVWLQEGSQSDPHLVGHVSRNNRKQHLVIIGDRFLLENQRLKTRNLVVYLSHSCFLLTNQSSCSLIQIRSCHWSTSGTVLSIILFYSDSFISLLTSTSYWFASSFVVMSSEGQSQKRLKTSAKWLSVHSQHWQIWEF